MANLTIRDFPDELRDRLRIQAARHGRSMEAEARQLLMLGLSIERGQPSSESSPRELQDWIGRRLVGGPADRPNSSDFIRDRRREVILDVISEGHDPAVYFGADFSRICREAGWSEQHVRQLAVPCK